MNDFWGKDATAQIDCTPEPRKKIILRYYFSPPKS
jgi:hypothetical protein